MLAVRRPYNTQLTKLWTIEHILKPARELGYKPLLDTMGNTIVRVGESETLFSCHTDTVHRDPGVQCLMYDPEEETIWKNDGQALGADNGAGVFVLMGLMRARVPGLYMFHVGEERGCIGSRHIAEKSAHLLVPIKRAIAFDRRGTKSVITKMSPGIVCSPEFAKALCSAIGMGHEPDPTGSMTDTGRYRELVPECTNVSVGYASEHGGSESLNARYVADLIEHLVKVDFEALPTVRDPKDKSWGVSATTSYTPHTYQGRNSWVMNAAGTWQHASTRNLPPPAHQIKKTIDHTVVYYTYESAQPKETVVVEPTEEELEKEEAVRLAEIRSMLPSPLDDPEAFLALLFEYIDLDQASYEGEFIWDALMEYMERRSPQALKFADEFAELLLDYEVGLETMKKAS